MSSEKCNCKFDLPRTEKICDECGGDVEIDESEIKKCHKCKKISKLTAKFCNGCRSSFKDVTKEIICEGKREDDIKLSPCDTRLRKEDDHEGGNDKNQPEELDGRDDEDRPEQKTEKQTIETIENTTQKPISKGDEPEKRGLAIVCSHLIFIHKGHKLEERDSASNDHAMMKSLWDLYGCRVIDFTDKGSKFYDTELIDKIDDELKKIENLELFVFVLSSHGEEKEEKRIRTDKQGIFQHYFYTKDGQCSTQDLMSKIANIEKLENKLKIFIIQACRSRTVAKDENEDLGVEIELEKGNELSGGQNDGTVHPDAKGCMPHEDEKNKPDDKKQDDGTVHPDAKPDDKRQNDGTDHPDAKGYMPREDEKDKPENKRQNDGIDLPDARGYMPPEDEDEDVIQPTNVASGRTEAHGEMESEVENSSSELIIDLPPAEGVPHCDDCVVMFASMSGKYAYSRHNTQTDNGGWLIKSVDNIFKKYEKGQKAHILDILVEINREVGTRDTLEKRKTCEIPNLDLEIQMENLQPRLKTHVNELREICRKYSLKVGINKCQDELDELATKIDKDGHTEDSLNIIKDETVHLTEKFKEELHSVTVKSQSSFFHNLAFDDEDLLLCKIKES